MENGGSPQPVFQKPSLSHEAEAVMDESLNIPKSSSTVSLATNTSGTTFAARARAAELNAARARKVVKAVESDEDIPSSIPVNLGSVMRFTKPRAKPKAWKALNLQDLPETETDTITSSMQRTQSDEMGNVEMTEIEDSSASEHSLGQSNIAAVRILQSHMLPSTEHPASSHTSHDLSPGSKKLAQMVADYDASEWDPDMPTVSTNNSRPISRASSSHVSSQQASRPSSAMTLEHSGTSHPVPVAGGPTIISLRQIQEDKIAELESKTVLASRMADNPPQRLNLPQEAKLAELGVLPSIQIVQHHRYQQSEIMVDSGENPFDESPPSLYQFPSRDSAYESSYEMQNEYRVPRPIRHQYPAVKGTMNYDFRFPTQHPIPGNLHVFQHQPSHLSAEKPDHFNNNFSDPHASEFLMPSGPPTSMPYNRQSTEGKKDMLRRNLDTLVDLSVPQGSFATSTRTVLYDPVAHTSTHNPAVASAPPNIPTESEVELLVASDPLPWKDRPVDIHDASTPALSNAELAIMSSFPHFQLVPQQAGQSDYEAASNQNASLADVGAEAYTVEEIERWWHGAAPGQQEVINYLGQAGAEYRERKRVEDNEARSKAAQRRANLSEDWSESSDSTTVPEDPRAAEICKGVMLPVMANLYSYFEPAGYFGRYGRAAEWTVDQGHGGQASFFGEDWGAPPQRVGRDPRYRPMLHEGRYTVFDDMGGRNSGDGFGRKYR